MKDFLGFSGTPVDFGNVFDVVFNDDGLLYMTTREMYRHEDPEKGYKFDYRYGIKVVCPFNAACIRDCDFIDVTLYLVPEPKDWCDEALRMVAEMAGFSGKSRDEIIGMVNIMDAEACNFCPVFGNERITFDLEEHDEGFYNVLDNAEVVEMLDMAASVVGCVDSFRGMAFDSVINGLGVTNWDVLDEVLNNRDSIKTALGRLGGNPA